MTGKYKESLISEKPPVDLIFIVGYLFMLVDIVMLEPTYDLLHLIGITLIFFLLRKEKSFQMIIVGTLLVLMPTLAISNNLMMAEKAAIWLFYFLAYKILTTTFLLKTRDKGDL